MHEADHVLPAEEIDLFLRQHIRVQSARQGSDAAAPEESSGVVSSDPFAVAPREFG